MREPVSRKNDSQVFFFDIKLKLLLNKKEMP
jgi:hypothetical protein